MTTPTINQEVQTVITDFASLNTAVATLQSSINAINVGVVNLAAAVAALPTSSTGVTQAQLTTALTTALAPAFNDLNQISVQLSGINTQLTT